MTAVSVAKSPKLVSTRLDGDVAIVRLERPQKRNALLRSLQTDDHGIGNVKTSWATWRNNDVI